MPEQQDEELAVYVGEAGNCLTDGTALVPGVTIAKVSRSEAETSDLWEPVKNPANAQPASDQPRNSPPSPPPPPAEVGV